MKVLDVVEGSGHHKSVARLHLRTNKATVVEGGWRAGTVIIDVCADATEVQMRPTATGFGERGYGPCIEATVEGELPHRLALDIRLVQDGRASSEG